MSSIDKINIKKWFINYYTCRSQGHIHTYFINNSIKLVYPLSRLLSYENVSVPNVVFTVYKRKMNVQIIIIKFTAFVESTAKTKKNTNMYSKVLIYFINS